MILSFQEDQKGAYQEIGRENIVIKGNFHDEVCNRSGDIKIFVHGREKGKAPRPMR